MATNEKNINLEPIFRPLPTNPTNPDYPGCAATDPRREARDGDDLVNLPPHKISESVLAMRSIDEWL